jgi:hypothetical protein
MSPHTRRRAVLLVTSTLLGTGSCAIDKERSGYPFKCGELDFYDVVALIYELRAYEVACGAMPENPRALHNLSWREVAAEYRDWGPRSRCGRDNRGAEYWGTIGHTCAVEASVNLLIHGYQVMGCPSWQYDTVYRPSHNYYLPFSDFLYDLEWTIEDICSGDTG